jgi:hypothetical protein
VNHNIHKTKTKIKARPRQAPTKTQPLDTAKVQPPDKPNEKGLKKGKKTPIPRPSQEPTKTQPLDTAKVQPPDKPNEKGLKKRNERKEDPNPKTQPFHSHSTAITRSSHS